MKLKWILVALCTLSFFSYHNANSVDSIRYWVKVKAHNKFERSVAADVGLAIEFSADDYVTGTANLQELRTLEKMGWVETSFPLTEALDFPAKDGDFHNYQELTDELGKLVMKYPRIVQMFSIGKSTEGRDIWGLRISGDLKQATTLPGIIFMAGHHAREHLSVETPLRIFISLLERYAQGDQRIVDLINSRDIHYIPAVNPDGLEYDVAGGKYRMWRKNRSRNADGTSGVDLNRNYGYQWGTGGSSKDTTSDIYMGPRPFSEPETQAIKAYVEANQNITTLLSFHTFSELILYPWGHSQSGIAIAKDREVHEKMARTMAQWNGYKPQQSSELYIASGDTTDWSYGEHKIISFTFELDPTNTMGGAGFYPGASVIPGVVQKNTEPVLYLMQHAGNPYEVL